MTVPLYNLSDSWNNAGTVFNAILMNVADSGHAASSALFKLQISGITKFSVDPNGAITGQNFTASAQGLVPASGGGTGNYLRADGAWAAPAAGTGAPGGSNQQVQYNDGGLFNGIATLAYNKTTNILTAASPGTLFDMNGTDNSLHILTNNALWPPAQHSFRSVNHLELNQKEISILDPGFSNLETFAINMAVGHGDYTYNARTQAKTTYFALDTRSYIYAAGQKFHHNKELHAFGMGDAFMENNWFEFACGPIMGGDEGQSFASTSRAYQPQSLVRCNVTSVTRASGNTTITPAIVGNRTAQTVAVASTAGIVVNDWYVVERAVSDQNNNSEAVQIIAVGGGTITAMFRNIHPAGSTLTPALVLGHTFTYPGQLRTIVNLSGSVYNTGQIISSSGGALVGSGTAWANNMVGGDAFNIGAIALTKDDFTRSPFDNATNKCRSWYELVVASPTVIGVYSNSQAGDLGYYGKGSFPSNYEIRPAVRLLRLTDAGTIICDTTTTVWNVGDLIECAFCPFPDCRGMRYEHQQFTAGGIRRDMFQLNNLGCMPFQIGLGLGASSNITIANGGPGYAFENGVQIGYTQTALQILNCTQTAIFLDCASPDTNAIQKILWNLSGGMGSTILANNAYGGFDFTGNSTLRRISMYEAGLGPNSDANLAEFQFQRGWLDINDGNVAGQHPRIEFNSGTITQGKIDAKRDVIYNIGDYGIAMSRWDQGASAEVFMFGISAAGCGTPKSFNTLPSNVTMANGANTFQSIKTSFIRIVGPTGAFSIAGFSIYPELIGSAPDGCHLHVYNTTSQAMTIVNESGSDARSIRTMTAADVVLAAGNSIAEMIYSASESRWLLVATRP